MIQPASGLALPASVPPRPPVAQLVAPVAAAPPLPAARMRPRHWGLVLSFVALVLCCHGCDRLVPVAARARPIRLYVGFSVRRQEAAGPLDMLGGLAAVTGSSSPDTDILYEYMQSPDLVADIDAELDLRAIWFARQADPVFAFNGPGTIEDLVDHWQRKVRISYDSGTQLIEVRVLAFDPDDAARSPAPCWNGRPSSSTPCPTSRATTRSATPAPIWPRPRPGLPPRARR